jgi:anhydro-N-acetylmuramic acid kinase
MSGTSYDAIETATAELHLEDETLVLRPLGSHSVAYDAELRTAIAKTLPPAVTSAEAMCKLDTRLGQAFAAAAAQAAEEFCDGGADLVVSHGQTVFHWVEGGRAFGTLQLGQPAWIAERTGSPVVSDLRSRDVAAGGHGAPLVSLFDVLLLGRGPETRAALNLGGIANLTILPAGGSPFAFDVGPANALIDAAVEHLTGGQETYDEDGRRAARGTVHEGLLRVLLDDPYFDLDPPKSTGKEHFNLSYLLDLLEPFGEIEADDLVATVTALTARTVADALNRHGVGEVVASGGGTHNSSLMRLLRSDVPATRLRKIEAWGIPSEAKEAYAFAVLGFLSMHGVAGTVPTCTGAVRATVLGSITPGPEPLALPTPAKSSPTRLRVETVVGEEAR